MSEQAPELSVTKGKEWHTFTCQEIDLPPILTIGMQPQFNHHTISRDSAPNPALGAAIPGGDRADKL